MLCLFHWITYILRFMTLNCVNQTLSHHEFLEHIFKPSSCSPGEAVSVLHHKIGRFFAKTALYKGLVACINNQGTAFKDRHKPHEQTANQANNIFFLSTVFLALAFNIFQAGLLFHCSVFLWTEKHPCQMMCHNKEHSAYTQWVY